MLYGSQSQHKRHTNNSIHNKDNMLIIIINWKKSKAINGKNIDPLIWGSDCANTPRQGGACTQVTPTLLISYEKYSCPKVLWRHQQFAQKTKCVNLECIFSQIKWQSISICFVNSWKTAFLANVNGCLVVTIDSNRRMSEKCRGLSKDFLIIVFLM